jgi:MscS family membrane protein
MVSPDPARVRFVGFAAYSLDVEIIAYVRCVNRDTFLAVQEDLFLRMADIVSEAGRQRLRLSLTDSLPGARHGSGRRA